MRSKVVPTVNNFSFWRTSLLKGRRKLGSKLKEDVLSKSWDFFVPVGVGWGGVVS